MSKSNGTDATEWVRGPKPIGSIWERIGKVIYDTEEGSFLGRTPKRWGVVFVFYTVFYAVLGALFAVCMTVLHLTLDPVSPKWTLDYSLIGVNPGLALRPRAADFGPHIEYGGNATGYDYYTAQLTNFLSEHENRSVMETYTSCVPADNYGYPDKPCVYVKLNKIYNWLPEYYDDVGSLPADMPEDLKEYIKSLEPEQRKQVWVSCEDDHGNITIRYPWGRGLPSEHFPYTNQEGYLIPLVAVQVEPPPNTEVAVHCRVWAKNVLYRKSLKEPSGTAWCYIKINMDEFNPTAEFNTTETNEATSVTTEETT